MIGAFAAAIVGKVLLDGPRSESHRTEYGDVTGRMVAQPQHQVRIYRGEFREYAKIDEGEVLRGSGVVRVALHQQKLRIQPENDAHSSFDISQLGCTGGEQHRLVLAGDVLEDARPGDVARPDLVSGYILVEHVYRSDIVGRRKKMDSGFVARRLEPSRPFPGDRRTLIDFEYGLLPLALVRQLRAGLEPLPADDALGAKVLELGRVGSCFSREVNESNRALDISIVVCRDICDEIGRVVVADHALRDSKCWH